MLFLTPYSESASKLRNINALLRDRIAEMIQRITSSLGSERSLIGLRSAIERLDAYCRVLKELEVPVIPTRRLINASEILALSLAKLYAAIREYMRGFISIEDLNKFIERNEELLKSYLEIIRGERLKTRVITLTPHFMLLLTIAYIAAAKNPSILANTAWLTPLLALASLIILFKNPILSYILNCLGGLSLLIVVLIGPLSLSEKAFTSILLAISMISSVLYSGIVKVSASEKTIGIVNTFFNKVNFVEEHLTTNSAAKSVSQDDLSYEVIKEYRKVYGSYGDDLFKFRLSSLVVSGIPYDEALRKLVEEIKGSVRD